MGFFDSVRKAAIATREPSKRQQSKWVSWPELKKLEKTVIQSLDQTFRSAPATMNSTANKKMQRSLQFLCDGLFFCLWLDRSGRRHQLFVAWILLVHRRRLSRAVKAEQLVV